MQCVSKSSEEVLKSSSKYQSTSERDDKSDEAGRYNSLVTAAAP